MFKLDSKLSRNEFKHHLVKVKCYNLSLLTITFASLITSNFHFWQPIAYTFLVALVYTISNKVLKYLEEFIKYTEDEERGFDLENDISGHEGGCNTGGESNE